MNAALWEYREAVQYLEDAASHWSAETALRAAELHALVAAARERLDRAVEALVFEGIFKDRIETQVLPSGAVVYATPAPLQAATVMGLRDD